MLPRVFLIVACFSVICSTSLAQEIEGKTVYKPAKAYRPIDLISTLERRAYEAENKANTVRLRERYEIIHQQLMNMAEKGLFLKDVEMEALLNSVMQKIIAANKLSRKPEQFLIIRQADVNAFCFGEGTFGITTGLLARITNESTLAQVLGHEIAHYELNHTKKTATADKENKTGKKIRRGVKEIQYDDKHVTQGDLDSLKKWVYTRFHFTRELESEADSLGLILATNAGYDQKAALTLISILDSARTSKFPLGSLIHDTFNSVKVPFQDDWLAKRLSLFDKAPGDTFFSNDSLETHPGLPLRRQALNQSIGTRDLMLPESSTSFFPDADLENIQSAIHQKKHDHALMLAITMLPHQPEHSAYLKSVITSILADVYQARGTPLFGSYVSAYTAGYGKELKQVNAFLNNIHKPELGELAFDFMNRKGNFDPAVEVHYYQLWRICNLTGRDEVKDKVKKVYREKFGKGEYYGDMDNPIQIGLPKSPKTTRGYN
ncbi:MAG: M48 family metalloprotease [Bacteroidota bacterium]